jgi:hypothetical protein
MLTVNAMRLSYWILIFTFTSCLQSCEQNKSNYLRHVGDIEFDSKIDNPNFKCCHDEDRIKQYFNFGKGLQYKGEKYAIVQIFKDNYKPVAINERGLIRIRFIVNCKGESGRFRIDAMDVNYNPSSFDERISDQILRITRGLDAWLPLSTKQGPQDYYQYLIFNIENGDIKEILP